MTHRRFAIGRDGDHAAAQLDWRFDDVLELNGARYRVHTTGFRGLFLRPEAGGPVAFWPWACLAGAERVSP